MDEVEITPVNRYGKKLPPKKYWRTTVKYDYEETKCHCPVCGGLGVPWRRWFTCEDCQAIALIETGETFIPKPPDSPV